MWFWGNKPPGQAGDGVGGNCSGPAPVIGVAAAVSVAEYFNNVCVLKIDDSLWCWGSNSQGLLGMARKNRRMVRPRSSTA